MRFPIVFSCGWAFVLVFVSGCGNYTSTTRQARDEFYSGQYSEAAKLLEKGAHDDGVNQLLYLFDRATALHEASEFEESLKDFASADQLAVIKDYTSLATEAATLVSNDKIVSYKAEDFENVLISQYLALNYLFLRKYEDALVECRRVNHKLQMMISQGKRKYKLNPMANYLAALMYEDQREWSDAYVDYQEVKKLLPEFPYLGEDLYRLAWRNQIFDDQMGTAYWAAQYQLSADDQKRIRQTADKPEIVIIVENGKSPEKKPNPAWKALPKYYPRYNPVDHVEVLINGQPRGQSYQLFDVETTAIENLDEKWAGMLAKKIAGVVTKEVIADQVSRRTNPLFGAIARVGMYAADQADLRSWLTLPKDFQIYRVRVEPGQSYKIQIKPKTAGDGDSGQTVEKLVQFEANRPGQRAFVHVRVL